MLEARTVGKFPTRRPKGRAVRLPLTTFIQGNKHQVDVEQENHPGAVPLPVLERPGILEARQKFGISVSAYELIAFGKDPMTILRDDGLSVIQLSFDWDVTSYCRMIAKIAYGFAVVSQGPLSRELVPVLPFILRKKDDGGTWLGSSDFSLQSEKEKPTHALDIQQAIDPTDADSMILVSRVKLFASSGATGYEVVVYRPSSVPLLTS